MSVFEHIDGDGYEQVVFCSDDQSGLRAIVAIHSTALGPALVGTSRQRSGSRSSAPFAYELPRAAAFSYQRRASV